MPHIHRRPARIGAATSLLALTLALGSAVAASPALAQDRGVGPGATAGYDDDRLYQDENGTLYRRRNGAYEPYRGRVMHGRPVPDLAVDVDPDAQAYARRRAALPAEPVSTPSAQPGVSDPPIASGRPAPAAKIDDGPIDYARAYGPVEGEPFPIQPFNWKKANPAYLRQEVAYTGPEAPGTIIVDPRAHQLLLVQPNGRARRYGVGVGKQGFSWSGASTVNSKQAWPDWYPPKEMIARTPKLAREVSQLQSGLGVPGGSRNPLGARAMYLWQNNKDTLFRIHGTTDPSSIGRSVSSGCIRMINQDAIDLFNRVEVGAKVVVLG